MEKLGYVNSFFKLLGYSLASEKRKEKIRRRRLHDLVMYAKANSPYFAKVYAEVGEDFRLEDLPIINKDIMREHFDEWHTVSGITMQKVQEFIRDEANLGKLYLDKYTIVMTSGSTGKPAVILQDSSMQNLYGCMAAMRAMKFRFPIVNICHDTGFGIDNESIRHNKGKASILNKLVSVVDACQTESKIVEDVEKIRPKVIFGYTGVISLLANEAALGRLHIQPKFIFTSGEYMSEAMRQKIAEAFPTAEVHSIYGCTEGGSMAYECHYNHFHVNDDWIILEAVDENNKPVPLGQPSSKLLLTNLANGVHPLIRYELGDRVVLHQDDCPCGKHSIWIEVDGRSNADLEFQTAKGTVMVPCMILFEIFEDLSSSGLCLFDSYQMILKTDQRLEVRLHILPGTDREEVFRDIREAVLKYLHTCGIEGCEMYLSDVEPQVNTRTGKVIRIYQENGQIGMNRHVVDGKNRQIDTTAR